MAKSFGWLHQAVRTLIPTLSKTFKSRAAALSFLKDEDMGIRKTDFLKYWSEITGSIQKGERIKYVRQDRTPSRNLVGFSEHNIQNQFQVIGEIGYTDSLTGKDSKRKISFLTGVLKNKADMEGTLFDIASDAMDEYHFGAISKLDIVEIRSPSAKYA